MTDDMAAIRASDELITALSQRREPPERDLAVDALAALAEYVDAAPRPRLERLPASVAHRRPRTHRRLGVAIGVALAVSSSGIAAAVTGDPLSPVNFVAKNLYDFAKRHTGTDQQLGAGLGDRQVASSPSQNGSHPLEQQSASELLSPVGDRLVGAWLESPQVAVVTSEAADPLSPVLIVDPADALPGDADAGHVPEDDAVEDQTIPDTGDEAEPEPDPVIDPAPGEEDVPPDTCIPPIPDDGTTEDGQGEPTSCDNPSDPAPDTEPAPEPQPEPQPEPETEPAPEPQPEPELDPQADPQQEPEPGPDRIPEDAPAPADVGTTP